MERLSPTQLTLLRVALAAVAATSAGWGLIHRNDTPPSGSNLEAIDSQEVWFSRPELFTGEPEGGPEEALIRAIDEACRTVDVASYDFDLLPVARALVRAHRRGVQVRVLTDSDNLPSEAVDLLRAAGVAAHGDTSPALMHDKFVVLDGREVWMGSMNLTVNDAYRNNNNFARLESAALASSVTAEFEEMFVAGVFGAASPAGAGGVSFTLPSGEGRLLFAPDDSPAAELAALVRGAQRSVHILAFSFTSAPLAEAAWERARAGAEVWAVLEKSLAMSSGERIYRGFLDQGIDARLDANPRNMHHKVLILDGETVVFGSYNFSENAENRNDEILVIVRSRTLASAFEAEFARVRKAAAAAA